MRKSSTGFLMYGGETYPVKPLGRLANEIAGQPMKNNPSTNYFRRHFEHLNFQLIGTPENEAEAAVERQRRLAVTWQRPKQAKFRREVFALYGARCIVTGCEALKALEAAHILAISDKGTDDPWNGIPLRADIHRLFDAGRMILSGDNWIISILEPECKDYEQYNNLDISGIISTMNGASRLSEALLKRSRSEA